MSLASKVKSLALKPQLLENSPVLGLRTALFFELLKGCGAPEKFFEKLFFSEIALKIFLETFFFWRSRKALALVPLDFGLEHSCSWPREGLSSVELSLALASVFFLVLILGLGLELCVLDSTSSFIIKWS